MMRQINKWFYGNDADEHNVKETMLYILAAPVAVAGLFAGCVLIGIL